MYTARDNNDLSGALPAGLGDLGPALKRLSLVGNRISELPTEIGTLTGLVFLNLVNNQLTGVPAEFRTVNPSKFCLLSGNPSFSCANVGFGTTCCTSDNCGDTPTCYGAPPCAYADTACAAGAECPGGTAVSAACADRSKFSENPCACTALQQLAALSDTLQNEAPWDNLANKAYCQESLGGLQVACAPVGGVQLPTGVYGDSIGLAGALPPSLGELGSSLTILGLAGNVITSVPTELGALTGLEYLDLTDNQLTGVPAEFRTVNPPNGCQLYDNAGFSCANVGAGTSCCDAFNCPAGTSTCYQG